MIDGLKGFFRRYVEPAGQQDQAASEHALQVATAALLLEMMRMDNQVDASERTAIVDAMRREFQLDEAEFTAIHELAEQAAHQAHDYYQFTSLINQRCDAAQKVRIVENLWRVAMADRLLDAHELHLMRKLADLLHIGHGDYVAAKQRAREAMKLPPV